ncbi:MAG: phage terminase large subunit [Undibacterium sp.]
MAVTKFSLKLHPKQRVVMSCRKRFRVVVAGRRWGKTITAKTELIVAAAKKSKQLVWYVAPTYQMARGILWEDLKNSIPRDWVMKNGINETRMTIRLINHSLIALKGADKPDTLRGVGINFLVMDEVQDIKKDCWYLVLRPTLAAVGGEVLFIGTPKSYNWLHDIYVEGQKGDTYKDSKGRLVNNPWMSWQFPTYTSPFIPKKELLDAWRTMDPKQFAQEFLASFETMSGRVYYSFDRRDHVSDFPFNPLLPIVIGQDFNIDPMSSVICQVQANGDIWVVDEVVLKGSNTEEAGNEISRRYYKQQQNVTIYPDPAGANRSHARGESDLDILRELGFKKIIYRRKHPPVADRINSVNRLLKTADGSIRLFVDRKCKEFIDSLEKTIYKEGSRDVDKSGGTEHSADAFGYYAEYEHPVREMKIGGRSF